MKIVKVLSRRFFKAGYEVREELIDWGKLVKKGRKTKMKSAYTINGDYIGSSKDAYRLCYKMGIWPIKAHPEHCVCSIGYCPKEKKWYGWSHKAIFGFKIGSTCKKGDCHYVPRSKGGKGKWTAKTILDAKRMAMDFAEGVA